MKILFVCTGNSCRSPMAEVLARDAFFKHRFNAEAASRGISVIGSDRASLNAQIAVKDYGLDLSRHVSRQITTEDLECFDLILTMTQVHKEHLNGRLDGISHKVYTLCEYSQSRQGDVMDPYGGDLYTYKKCASEIKDLVQNMLYKLL